jgi:ribosomal protein S4
MAPVSERDKAYVISAIASEKLMAQEASLTTQWTTVDNKLKEHLKAGRKPLALVALKERKVLEQRLEEIQIYKLKLAESTSVTQTAVIQQAVLEAISVGNKAAQITMAQTCPEDVEEILEQAEELRNEVKQISESVAGSIDIDDAVLLEYEELVKKRDDDKHLKALDMIDSIPSPPTELPEIQIPQATPKTSAPQLVVPEEWFSDIKE